MILRGRLSLYGEYLMRGVAGGLVMPSPFCIAGAEHENVPQHRDYDAGLDSVAALLRARGLPTLETVHGNLPLGAGYASSTALALLHLDGSVPQDEVRKLVNDCDRVIHGFCPSGVDVTSCLRGTPGLYSHHGWEDITLVPLRFALLHFPRERNRTLAEIDSRMASKGAGLAVIANRLTKGARNHARLDHDLLLAYARRLLECDVYSNVVARFVSAMLREQVAAKAIGGLYDKDVIAIWPDAEGDPKRGMDVIDSFAPLVRFDGRWPLE